MQETVSSAKFSGVTISRDMNWSEHINNVCTKANKTLGFLKTEKPEDQLQEG